MKTIKLKSRKKIELKQKISEIDKYIKYPSEDKYEFGAFKDSLLNLLENKTSKFYWSSRENWEFDQEALYLIVEIIKKNYSVKEYSIYNYGHNAILKSEELKLLLDAIIGKEVKYILLKQDCFDDLIIGSICEILVNNDNLSDLTLKSIKPAYDHFNSVAKILVNSKNLRLNCLSLEEFINSDNLDYLLNLMTNQDSLCHIYINGDSIRDLKFDDNPKKDIHNLIVGDTVQKVRSLLARNEIINCCNLVFDDAMEINVWGLADEEMKDLKENLRYNHNIQELNLWKHKMTDKGADYLTEALQDNHYIKKIIIDPKFSPDKMARIYDIMVRNNIDIVIQEQLKEIDLHRNKMSIQGIKYIAEMLSSYNNLERIDLAFNDLTSQMIKHLVEPLKSNNNLKTMLLWENNIGDEGCKYLAEVLHNSNALELLTLDNNNITAVGAKYIFTALKDNKRLQGITLGENNIGDEGIQYIVDALKDNNTVRHIHLVNNGITDEGADCFIDALEENYVLQDLDLNKNLISEFKQEKINKFILRNNKIAAGKLIVMSNNEPFDLPSFFDLIIKKYEESRDTQKIYDILKYNYNYLIRQSKLLVLQSKIIPNVVFENSEFDEFKMIPVNEISEAMEMAGIITNLSIIDTTLQSKIFEEQDSIALFIKDVTDMIPVDLFPQKFIEFSHNNENPNLSDFIEKYFSYGVDSVTHKIIQVLFIDIFDEVFYLSKAKKQKDFFSRLLLMQLRYVSIFIGISTIPPLVKEHGAVTGLLILDVLRKISFPIALESVCNWLKTPYIFDDKKYAQIALEDLTKEITKLNNQDTSSKAWEERFRF